VREKKKEIKKGRTRGGGGGGSSSRLTTTRADVIDQVHCTRRRGGVPVRCVVGRHCGAQDVWRGCLTARRAAAAACRVRCTVVVGTRAADLTAAADDAACRVVDVGRE